MLNSLSSINLNGQKGRGLSRKPRSIQFGSGTTGNNLGTSQALTIGTGQFTIEFWIKNVWKTQPPYNYNGFDTALFTVGSNHFEIFLSAGGSGRLSITIGGSVYNDSNSTINTTAHGRSSSIIPSEYQWRHFVFQRNSDNKVRLFVDGVLEYVTVAITTNILMSTGFFIGKSNNTTPATGTLISGFRISNTARYPITMGVGTLANPYKNFTPPINPTDVDSNTIAAFDFATNNIVDKTGNYTLFATGNMSFNTEVPT